VVAVGLGGRVQRRSVRTVTATGSPRAVAIVLLLLLCADVTTAATVNHHHYDRLDVIINNA
jgi:hypothetical protein